MSNEPNEGDLRVWWIPQIPMKAFKVSVASVEEAAKIMEVLAHYDLFQFENKVKPDYSNMGGLEVFEGGEWLGWECPETYETDPVEWLAAREAKP
jgi:hypothetical protein